MSLFFSARVAEEKDYHPNWRFMLSIAPFTFMDLLGSIVLVSFLAVLSKGISLAIAITIIIPSNLLFHRLMRYSKDLKEELERQKNSGNAHQIETFNKDIPKTLQLSALTSWLINSIVVKSKLEDFEEVTQKDMKLQLISSAISIIVYTLVSLFTITYQALKSRTIPRDFSIIVCFQQAPTADNFIPPTKAFFGTTPVLNISKGHFVRSCHPNELPLDVMWNVIVPCLCAALILKLVARIMIFKLSDHSRLLRFIKCFGGNAFHHILVIDRPGAFKEDNKLPGMLAKNIGLVNMQHPVSGKTIMHYAYEFLSTGDVIKLYKHGARIDIKDFKGVAVKDEWSETNQKEFDEALNNEELSVESCSSHGTFNLLLRAYTNNDLRQFSLLVVLGSQPNAKTSSGQSILEILANDLVDQSKQDGVLKYLKYLHYEDIFDILALVLLKQDNKEDALRILTSAFQSIETYNQQGKKST